MGIIRDMFEAWRTTRKSRKHRGAKRRAWHVPLAIECLEDRLMMAGDLRTAMPGEGYLHLDLGLEVGQERLGATQITHPTNLVPEL